MRLGELARTGGGTSTSGRASRPDDRRTASRAHRSGLALAGFLVVAGAMHFVVPTLYDRIIPRWVPGPPRWWTYGSGAAEIASGALVAIPRTRRFGAWAAVVTFVAVYPANLQMAFDESPRTLRGLAVWLRLPGQLPLVAWALGHARRRANR